MMIEIYFIVVILGLLFQKSKFVRTVQYMSIYIIFVFNNWSQDDIYYRRIFSGYYGLSHEPGFDLVCQIFYRNGIQYETFRAIYVSIAIILLLFALNKLFKNASNRAYSLILLYPLLPLVELLRNLMAIAIVANGIAWYFSVEREKIKDKIIYVLIVLLGATFHYNVLFFLIIILTKEKRLLKSSYLQIVAISIISIVAFNLPAFKGLLALLFNSEKVLNWFAASHRIDLGIIIVLGLHIISFGIYDYIYRAYYYRSEDNKHDIDGTERISKQLYSLNIYSFALMGLYTYNMQFFSRIYIVFLLLNSFHVSTMIKKVKNKNIIIFGIIQVLYYIGLFVFFCQPFNPDGIMSFTLRNNSLFPEIE